MTARQTTQPKRPSLLAAFRVKPSAEVQAAADAQLARAILAFDDLDAYMGRVLGAMRADGILEDRRMSPRGVRA